MVGNHGCSRFDSGNVCCAGIGVPCGYHPVNTQGYFTSATPPTVTTQNATGTVINANGQTAGYFHGTLTAKGTNDTSAIQVWFEYGTTTSYGSTTSQSHNE